MELQNENPAIITSIFEFITDFIATYGWYLLFSTIVLLYIYNKYISESLQKYLQRKSEDEYAAKYHKDPDLLNARMTAMEEARRKMQEKLDKEVEDFKIKQKLKEERKRAEWLEKHNAIPTGSKLGHKETIKEEKNKSLKPEYNPLAGDSSGSSYRAPKRSCCGGGSCS